MRERLRFAVQKTGPVRFEEFLGQKCRVFPAVLVREQVLRNNLGDTFLPREEIERNVEAWNMIPVVERHPMSRGQPISARTPDVLNLRGVGFLFRAAFNADKVALTADVFLLEDRLKLLPDTAAMVDAVNGGAAGELSTGFATNVEPADGEFDGVKYSAILRDIQPDHLALLPDETGACSTDDGCGLGVNRKGAPAPAQQKILARLTQRVLQIAKHLGLAQNESDEDRRMALSDALTKAFAGAGESLWVESVSSEDATVVFSVSGPAPELSGLFRSTYTAADGGFTFSDPVAVRRVTMYEPVANAAGDFTTKESIMNRSEMIAVLVARGPLKQCALDKLDDESLAALCAAKPAAATNTTEEIPRDAVAAWNRVKELNQELEQLRGQTATAVANEEKERLEIVEDLLCNPGRHQFSDNDVRAMDIVMLRKIHGTAFPKT